MNSKVDAFLRKANAWKEEFTHLRGVILDCGLTEELKWGVPCYTYEGRNVVLMHGFKQYCALLFMKGALMVDPKGILVQQTKNVQSARQIRFAGIQEIVKLERTVKAYVRQAIEIEKAGLTVTLKQTDDFEMSEEFRLKLESNSALKKAFHNLTPGRQRAYLLYFSAAKQTKTREARIERYEQNILDGKGMNDQ